MGPIRNKKQAMVRCLKRDVADLIAAGHDAVAFGRFVEKIQEKSFSKKKKLHLLQNIAEEFTLPGDSKTSGLQSHNAPAPKSKLFLFLQTRPKQVAASHNVDNGASSVKAAMKDESPSKRKYGSNPASAVRKHQGEVEQKDIHVISTARNRQSHDQVEKPGSTEDAELYQTDTAVRPFVKHKRSHDGIRKNDENEVDHPQSRTEKVQKEQHHSIEKQEVGSVKSRNVRLANVAPPNTKSIDSRFNVEETRGDGTVPPYTRLNWIENGHPVEGNIGNVREHNRSQRHEASDPTVVGKASATPVSNNGRGRYAMPPYVKPGVIDFSTNGEQIGVDDAKSDGTEHTAHQRERVLRDEKPKPVSTRRKSQRPPVTAINEGTSDDEKAASCTPGDQRRHRDRRSTGTDDENLVEEKIAIGESRSRIGDEMDNAIDYGKLLRRSSNGLRRHSSRHAAVMNDRQYDEEEMAVEKLLLHYSSKGTERDPIKERTTTNHVDVDRFERPVNSKIQLIQKKSSASSIRSHGTSSVFFDAA
ncbi:hypothetical protein B296_00026346 [Ensete ventricosum]|uniref:Uncharacterized protein n=1 Tax=Ensete ventricosum TaxID=4639 RepID=A0A426ZNP3_ENSVE|nr:hypothetical protein B296_00026346 [Ensete ventricosum]